MNYTPFTPGFLQAREAALQQWFSTIVASLDDGPEQGSLQPVSGDASFRRYFRGKTATRSWILMDAPPEREAIKPFIDIAGHLAGAGVCVPSIHAIDAAQGFLCLEDFASTLLWAPLHEAGNDNDFGRAGALYEQAMQQLVLIQGCNPIDAGLPAYDEALLGREVALFSDWFCEGILQVTPSSDERSMLDDAYGYLIEMACAQPRVFVHRDYHSRNLMYRGALPPGVLDFQDAVWGPVTYDLVSLLRDCYIAWPAGQVLVWAEQYRLQAMACGIEVQDDPLAFRRDFDLMGIQRHLKAVGIFSRLWLRDGKSAYMKDIPRTLNYITTVAPAYPHLSAFTQWLQVVVLPRVDSAIARETAKGKTA